MATTGLAPPSASRAFFTSTLAPIIARFRSSEVARPQEAEETGAIPSALDLMTDSSEEEEEIEKSLLNELHRDDSIHNSLKPPRGRFVTMPFVKNKNIWFVWDPCGIVCAVMTYILVLYGEFVMLTVIAPPFPGLWTSLSVLVFSSLGGLAVVAHVKSMITDPVSTKSAVRERTHCHETHVIHILTLM